MPRWKRAKRNERCPVCNSQGSDSSFKRGCEWTDGYKSDTYYVVCLNVSAGSFKESLISDFGKVGYHHIIDSRTHAHRNIDDFVETSPANAVQSFAAYDALLTGVLSPLHKAYFAARKLPPDLVASARYTTLSNLFENRNQIADGLARAGVSLLGVPGFWIDHKDHWRLEGPGGVLLPIRNADGYITGCQINWNRAIGVYMRYTAKGLPIPEEEKDKLKAKYLWLTSIPEIRTSNRTGNDYVYRKTGVPAQVSLHYPIQKTAPTVEDFENSLTNIFTGGSYLIVEGIMKSDVVAYFWEGPERIVGMPGGSACHREVAQLSMSADRVLLGVDPDWQVNDKFRMAVASLIEKIASRRVLDGVSLPCWPLDKAKGLDDLLLINAPELIYEIPAKHWMKQYA